MQHAVRPVWVDYYRRVAVHIGDNRSAASARDNGRITVLRQYRVRPISINHHARIAILMHDGVRAIGIYNYRNLRPHAQRTKQKKRADKRARFHVAEGF